MDRPCPQTSYTFIKIRQPTGYYYYYYYCFYLYTLGWAGLGTVAGLGWAGWAAMRLAELQLPVHMLTFGCRRTVTVVSVVAGIEALSVCYWG